MYFFAEELMTRSKVTVEDWNLGFAVQIRANIIVKLIRTIMIF